MEPNAETAMRLIYDCPLGRAIVDGDGRIRWVNVAFCSLLGYSEGELLGTPLIDVTADKFKLIDKLQTQRLKDGEIAVYSIVKALEKNGSTPKSPRLTYGVMTVFREPPKGDFEHTWILFVPFDGPPTNILMSPSEAITFVKDNYKWLAMIIALCVGVATGNWSMVSTIVNLSRGQSIEEAKDSSSSLPLPSPLPSPEAPGLSDTPN